MNEVPAPSIAAARTRHTRTRDHARHRELTAFTCRLTEHMRLKTDVLFPQFERAGQANG